MKLKLLIINLLLFTSTAFARYEPGWFGGSLLVPGANNISPGFTSVNNEDFFSKTKPGDINTYSIISYNYMQFGLTNWLDLTITTEFYYVSQKKLHTCELGDTFVRLGFQLLKENFETYEPSIRFSISENFPTGKFQKLNPDKNGIDFTSSAAYETHFSLIVSKEFHIFEKHPFILRAYTDYFFNTLTHVTDFHGYGGGYGTNGKVRAPRIFTFDLSFEFSLTKNWVFGMDSLYLQETASSFSGFSGFNPDGSLATNTVAKAKQVSFAPTIEYNITPLLAIELGYWFSVYGNYLKSIAFSFSYTF
jgi:hypothetical protein